jgi:hypothetical protein
MHLIMDFKYNRL